MAEEGQKWHWYWNTKLFNKIDVGAVRITSSDGEWAREGGKKIIRYRPTFSTCHDNPGFQVGWVGTKNWYVFIIGWD